MWPARDGAWCLSTRSSTGSTAGPRTRELARLLRGLQCHVNLIPLNHVDERRLRPATPEAVRAFQQTLEASTSPPPCAVKWARISAARAASCAAAACGTSLNFHFPSGKER